MSPEQIGTFEAAGDGGRRATVRVVLAFHKDPRTVGTPHVAWVPDPHPLLTLEDGRRVERMDGEPERYIVTGTAEVLTPLSPTADLFTQWIARRQAAEAHRGRRPG